MENYTKSSGNPAIDRILDSINAITREVSYIREAIEAFKTQGDAGNSLGVLVSAREETNRKSLELLEKMYDDIKPVDHRKEFFKGVNFNDVAHNMDSDDLPEFLMKILGIPDNS